MKRLFGLLIIAVVLPATTGNSQHVEQRSSLTTAGPAVAPPNVQVHRIAPLAGVQTYYSFQQNENRQEWDDAMKALRDADSESTKADAKNKIEELLTAQYDESLNNYDKYLEELSSKIAEMKTQVEKRRAARDEMVQLKLQMVVSEADGLGWPDDRQGPAFPSMHIQNEWGNGRNPSDPFGWRQEATASPAPDMPPYGYIPEGIIDSDGVASPPPKPGRPGGVR